MQISRLFCGFLFNAVIVCCTSACHYEPSANATRWNYPGNSYEATADLPPYHLNDLSAVPVASICNSSNGTRELACARKYIDAIDEQMAFLYARRLGYAAVAGFAKLQAGQSLNDPNRNEAVAEGMARRVLKYGGTENAGRVMGGEGCQIYASLEFEKESIRQGCDPNFDERFKRVCG
ncbi:hypothetical protein ACJZ2D_008905 [Fusarium nematophilum]